MKTKKMYLFRTVVPRTNKSLSNKPPNSFELSSNKYRLPISTTKAYN